MSKLHRMINDYLSVRRALGHKLEREGSLLPEFASFLKKRKQEFITSELAVEWATQSRGAATWHAHRLAMIRGFAKYMRANDARTQIPSPDLLPYRKSRHTPYIYTSAEITSLIAACHRIRSGKILRQTYATLIGLLACTGMRIGEAINLDRSDVNERERLITIRCGKFGKAREIPVHPTTIEALRAYGKRRDAVFRYPKSSSLLVSQCGKRLLSQNVWATFQRLRSFTGLELRSPKPRIHDLRHTFAVQTLLQWYSEGADVERRVALLSTYMGHVSPTTTYWYLSGTPELMAFAAKRLENFLGDPQ